MDTHQLNLSLDHFSDIELMRLQELLSRRLDWTDEEVTSQLSSDMDAVEWALTARGYTVATDIASQSATPQRHAA